MTYYINFARFIWQNAKNRLHAVNAPPDWMNVLIDGFGPDGVSARVIDVTRNVVRLQTGYLYHYAFAMLIGVAAFVTWFMFSSGGH